MESTSSEAGPLRHVAREGGTQYVMLHLLERLDHLPYVVMPDGYDHLLLKIVYIIIMSNVLHHLP